MPLQMYVAYLLHYQYIAHLELKQMDGNYVTIDLSELGLKVQDIDEAMRLLEQMVLDINGISRAAGYAIDSADHMFDRDANAFWGTTR